MEDPQAILEVGKRGLGDMDISDDGSTLYVVNLFQKTVIVIDKATKAILNQYNIPDPGCTGAGNEFRPFALKYFEERVFIGVVCDAEATQDRSHLSAMVYELNPMTGTFTTVLSSFSLDYVKGMTVSFCGDTDSRRWNPWLTDIADCSGFYAKPSPIFADIEFDVDGSMILGFMDRTSHQTGNGQFGFGMTSSATANNVAGGDILRASKSGSTFTIENNGMVGGLTGMSNTQGPGGGEFYHGEFFSSVHEEIAIGGLVNVPGKGEVVVTAIDPTAFWSVGAIYLSNTDGSQNSAYNVFTGTGALFGKSGGLGDLEVGCDPAPVEIGNYVWLDQNMDGIQDACEPALENIWVVLHDSDKNPIDSVQTDANGNYYFNSLTMVSDGMGGMMPLIEADSTYFITFGGGGQYDSATGFVNDSLSLTTVDSGTGTDGDVNDNDASSVMAMFNGQPMIEVTAPSAGAADHTVDAGFVAQSVCAIETVNIVVTCDDNGTDSDPSDDTFSYTIEVSGSNTGSTYSISGDDSQTALSYDVVNGPYGPFNVAGGNLAITVTDVDDANCSEDVNIIAPQPCSVPPPNPCTDDGMSVGGTVFNDVNYNGMDDASETGHTGIQVMLYECDMNGNSVLVETVCYRCQR